MENTEERRKRAYEKMEELTYANRQCGAYMTVDDENGNEVEVTLDYDKIENRLKT